MMRFTDLVTRAFSGGGDDLRFQIEDSRFVSGSKKLTIVSSVVIILFRKESPSRRVRRRNSMDAETRASLFSSDKIRGIHLAHTLFIFRLSFKITSIVERPTPTRSSRSLMLIRQSSSTNPRTVATKPSLISAGRPCLASSFVEFLPSEKRLCHLYTSDLHTVGFPVACESVCIVSVGDFPSVAHNFMIVRCSSVLNSAILV